MTGAFRETIRSHPHSLGAPREMLAEAVEVDAEVGRRREQPDTKVAHG
jgi:hypothetical protein